MGIVRGRGDVLMVFVYVRRVTSVRIVVSGDVRTFVVGEEIVRRVCAFVKRVIRVLIVR